MNSSGIGALVATLKAVRASGAILCICSLSSQVKMIFNLTKMDQVFKPFENRQEFEQKILATPFSE
jgi:anti-sigma B factor antagonist